jgi:hypothetical protein
LLWRFIVWLLLLLGVLVWRRSSALALTVTLTLTLWWLSPIAIRIPMPAILLLRFYPSALLIVVAVVALAVALIISIVIVLLVVMAVIARMLVMLLLLLCMLRPSLVVKLLLGPLCIAIVLLLSVHGGAFGCSSHSRVQ